MDNQSLINLEEQSFDAEMANEMHPKEKGKICIKCKVMPVRKNKITKYCYLCAAEFRRKIIQKQWKAVKLQKMIEENKRKRSENINTRRLLTLQALELISMKYKGKNISKMDEIQLKIKQLKKKIEEENNAKILNN